MKRKKIALLCAAVLAGAMLTACGSDKAASDKTAETAEVSEPETADKAETAEEPEKAADETEDTEADKEADKETNASSEADDSAENDTAALEDGVYTAEFDTDSSMFHVNEANEGKGTLTVKDGEMTIHVSLASKSIVNLFPGTAEDAQKDGAQLLEPTTDTVTYSDGLSDEVYGFDIPVPALDEEFDLALIGTKGKWYDHKVSVTNPVAE